MSLEINLTQVVATLGPTYPPGNPTYKRGVSLLDTALVSQGVKKASQEPTLPKAHRKSCTSVSRTGAWFGSGHQYSRPCTWLALKKRWPQDCGSGIISLREVSGKTPSFPTLLLKLSCMRADRWSGTMISSPLAAANWVSSPDYLFSISVCVAVGVPVYAGRDLHSIHQRTEKQP